MMRARSSRLATISSYHRRRSRARSWGRVAAQPARAVWATSTAFALSSPVSFATAPMVSPVAGSVTAISSLVAPAVQRLPT